MSNSLVTLMISIAGLIDVNCIYNVISDASDKIYFTLKMSVDNISMSICDSIGYTGEEPFYSENGLKLILLLKEKSLQLLIPKVKILLKTI